MASSLVLDRRTFLKLGVGAAVVAGLGSVPRRADAEVISIGAGALGAAIVALGLAFGACFRGNADRAVLGNQFTDYTAQYADQIADSAVAAATAAHQSIERSVVRDYAANGQLVGMLADAANAAVQAKGRMALDTYSALDTLGFGIRAAFAGFMDMLLNAPAATIGGVTVPYAVDTLADLAGLNVFLAGIEWLSSDTIATMCNLPTAASFCWVIQYPTKVNSSIIWNCLCIAAQAVDSIRTWVQSNGLRNVVLEFSSAVASGAQFIRTWETSSSAASWSTNTTTTNNITINYRAEYDSMVKSTVVGSATGFDVPWGADRKPEAILDPPMPWDAPVVGVDWKDVLGVLDSPGSIALPDVLAPGADVPFPGIDAIDFPWEKALYGEQVGIIEGIDSIPYPWAIPDVRTRVGTAEGTRVMPIETAISTPTSIAKSIDVPFFPPFNPPGELPQLPPWGDSAQFPFLSVFPFNMAVTVINFLGRVTTL